MNYYTDDELEKIGFKRIGKDVKLSRDAKIYGASRIIIGNHVRIDDFCILSGNIEIHDYIHIAPYCGLFAGDEGIVMEDFSAISSRSAIYAVTDDYCGDYITNPTVGEEFRHIIGGKVILKKHVIIGTGTTIMPDLIIGEGCAVGSMSFVNRSLEPWGIYVGIPARRIKERNKGVLEFEERLQIEMN